MEGYGGSDEFSSEAAAYTNLQVQLKMVSRQRDQAREDARLWQDRAVVAMQDGQNTQDILAKQLDDALEHVAIIQKRNTVLQQERENLKVQLLEKERLHQGHTNDLMQAVDQMRAELDETRSRLFALSQAGGESHVPSAHARQSSSASLSSSQGKEIEISERLRDNERTLRQVKARLMQVEAERDEGLREYDQLLSSFTTRCGQIQEQEQLHVQQLWKENEALANQLSAAQEEINSRIPAVEVQELRDHVSLMSEECSHAQEQWRMADSKEQHVRQKLARAMAKIAELKDEKNEVSPYPVSSSQRRPHSHSYNSFEAEEDMDYHSHHSPHSPVASSPDYYLAGSHSGPSTMSRSSGRDSPSRLLKFSRPHSPRSLPGIDDAGNAQDIRSPSAGSKEGSTPKKKSSRPSRVLAELVPLFASGRSSLRRRPGKQSRHLSSTLSVDDNCAPPAGLIKASFSQEVGSPSTPVRNLVNYFDDPVDGLISKRSSVGPDVFDSLSQGALSRQSRDFDDIGRELDRLRGESRRKDELCHEMRQRLDQSLKETASLRDDYTLLLEDARCAMAQIRTLKSKVYGCESPTPDVGLRDKDSELTEVRLPAEQELGFLVETHMIVSEVMEGLAADKNGGLQPGDHIVQINGISMVDQTHSAAILALALSKDGCTKLTVMKSGSEYVASTFKSLTSGSISQGELTPSRDRPLRKSKRWRIRQSVAEIISGRDVNSSATAQKASNGQLRRSNSDHRVNEESLTVRERFKRRPRRKTTGVDDETIEALKQVNALAPAKSVPNFKFMNSQRDLNHQGASQQEFETSTNGQKCEESVPLEPEDASWLMEQPSETTSAAFQEESHFVPPPPPESGRVSPELSATDVSQSVADGVRCIKVHPPPPGSMEAAKGPGLRLKGGCLVGIFVGQVNVDGPVGGKSGMRKHDQILSINGKDMKKATLEEAHTAFRPDKSGIINLSVIQNPIGYETMAVPYDALYIRCMFAFSPANSGELGFNVGDVLYVTETVPQRFQQSWLAFHVGSNSVRLLAGSGFLVGAIPNEKRAKKYIASMGGRCHCTGQAGGAPYKRLREEQVLDMIDMTFGEKEEGLDYSGPQGQHSGNSIDVDFPSPPPPEQMFITDDSMTSSQAQVRSPSERASLAKAVPATREEDVPMPWPFDVQETLCEAIDSMEHGWIILLEHFEKMGVSLSWRKSFRRKSRNSADTVIQRLYREKPVHVANQLLLDSLCAMRCTNLLELLLPYAGLPCSNALT